MVATALSGSSVSLRSCTVTSAVKPVETDVGHLADADVVDLDRRLRHQVEDVVEHDVHGDRVVADVGATGQRQLVESKSQPVSTATATRTQEQGAEAIHRSHLHQPAEGRVELLRPAARCRGRRRAARGAAGRSEDVLDDVTDLAGLVGLVDDAAEQRRRVALDLAADLLQVGAGVEGAGLRVVGVEQVVQRERGDLEDLVERVALLDQDLGDPVEALDVRRGSRGSPSRTPETCFMATPRLRSDAASSSRSPSSISDDRRPATG